MPSFVVFTEEEKARIRYHLGYIQSDPILSVLLGISALAQPQFLVEGQMNRMPDTAVSLVRQLIGRCDQSEQQLFDAQEFVVVSEVDEIKINPDKLTQLQERYRYWVQKLADNLGAPINAYASAFQTGGRLPLNITVVH